MSLIGGGAERGSGDRTVARRERLARFVPDGEKIELVGVEHSTSG